MFLLNPVVAMLYNTGLQRWHPVLFVECPLPGPESPGKPVRHKSHMHHTGGFPTREAALDGANELVRTIVMEKYAPSVRLLVDGDIPWDGEGVPALVQFFG